MKTQNVNIKSMEDKIHSINNQIDIFQSKAEKLPRNVSSELSSIIDDLKIKGSRLEDKLENFKGATDSAYKDLQVGVQMAWEDLNLAYISAKERFEKKVS